MLVSGDVVTLDFGEPVGRESGYYHPAIVVTAQRILDTAPAVHQVVPVTSAVRGYESDIEVDADPFNGLARRSAIQCQHIRAVATDRIETRKGHIGPVALAQIREVVGLILDIPE